MVKTAIVIPSRDRVYQFSQCVDWISSHVKSSKNEYTVFVGGSPPGQYDRIIQRAGLVFYVSPETDRSHDWSRGRALNMAIRAMFELGEEYDQYIIQDNDVIIKKTTLEENSSTGLVQVLGGFYLTWRSGRIGPEMGYEELFRLPVTPESALVDMRRQHHGILKIGRNAWREIERLNRSAGCGFFEEMYNWGCEDGAFVGKCQAIREHIGSIDIAYTHNAWRHVHHERNPKKPDHGSSNKYYESNLSMMKDYIRHYNTIASSMSTEDNLLVGASQGYRFCF